MTEHLPPHAKHTHPRTKHAHLEGTHTQSPRAVVRTVVGLHAMTRRLSQTPVGTPLLPVLNNFCHPSLDILGIEQYDTMRRLQERVAVTSTIQKAGTRARSERKKTEGKQSKHDESPPYVPHTVSYEQASPGLEFAPDPTAVASALLHLKW